MEGGAESLCAGGQRGQSSALMSTSVLSTDWSRSTDSRSDSEEVRGCSAGAGRGKAGPREGVEGVVGAVFGGKMHATVRCGQCGACSETIERFRDLSLDIAVAPSAPRVHSPPGESAGQSGRALIGAGAGGARGAGGGAGAPWFAACLEDALENYFAAQGIEGSEATLECEECGREAHATRRVRLSRVPPALVLHLKRYHFRGQKSHRSVASVSRIDRSGGSWVDTSAHPSVCAYIHRYILFIGIRT